MRHLGSSRSMQSGTAEVNAKSHKKQHQSLMWLHSASMLGTLIQSDSRHP